MQDQDIKTDFLESVYPDRWMHSHQAVHTRLNFYRTNIWGCYLCVNLSSCCSQHFRQSENMSASLFSRFHLLSPLSSHSVPNQFNSSASTTHLYKDWTNPPLKCRNKTSTSKVYLGGRITICMAHLTLTFTLASDRTSYIKTKHLITSFRLLGFLAYWKLLHIAAQNLIFIFLLFLLHVYYAPKTKTNFWSMKTYLAIDLFLILPTRSARGTKRKLKTCISSDACPTNCVIHRLNGTYKPWLKILQGATLRWVWSNGVWVCVRLNERETTPHEYNESGHHTSFPCLRPRPDSRSCSSHLLDIQPHT